MYFYICIFKFGTFYVCTCFCTCAVKVCCSDEGRQVLLPPTLYKWWEISLYSYYKTYICTFVRPPLGLLKKFYLQELIRYSSILSLQYSGQTH